MNKDKFVRDVRLADFTVRRLWPLLRPILGRSLARRCRRCVLSEASGPLNENGLCAACASSNKTLSENAFPADSNSDNSTFDRLLEEQVGKAEGPYDAMVLLSGGKDSAYLLHRLKRDHPGLRILAVMVNNGFMSPIALENAGRVYRAVGVDYMELIPDPTFVRSVFRWALTHLDRQKGYSIVDSLDGQITFDTAQLRAAEWKIPLVIAGLSKTQIENAFGSIGWEFPSDRLEWIAGDGVTRNDVFADSKGKFWYRPELWPQERRPRFLLPYVLWNPTETFILAEVEKIGLLDRRQISPLLTNNLLIPIIGLAEISRFGYCCFEVEFARMIREGKSKRKYWLNLFQVFEYAAKTGRFLGKSIDDTLAMIGLSKKDIGIG